jgi:hypothetical protein
MATSGNTPGLTYAVIILGVMLAATSAIQPFYDDAYHLRFGVLLSGMLPYLVYAVIAVMLQRPLTSVAGVALIALHAWLVFSVRYSGNVNAGEVMLYTVPILLALALFPLGLIALRQPWRGNDTASSRQ